MASVSGGYNHKFVEPPPDEYTCLICHSVCREPQQVSCCAKLYCKTCLDQHRKSNRNCPTCRESLETFDDKLSHRRIKALKVSCDNEDAGCQWAGELGSLKEHLAECELVEISCTQGCSEKVLLRDLDKHLTTSCPKRKYECPHCSLEGEHCEITTTHLDECPDVIIPCQNTDCGFQVKRGKMGDHLAVCPKQSIACSFADVGCKKTVIREKLSQHETKEVHGHLKLAVKTIASLKKLVKPPALVIPVVFKMTNFKELRDKNGVWNSPPFHTHTGGYNMILAVYANGSRERNRSHISVFVKLGSSDHDDNLVWPFRGTITVEILNQLEDNGHERQVLALDFPEGHGSTHVQRPLKGTFNVGYGYARFLSHSHLGHDAISNCQFLVDDCLYFRVPKVTINPPNKPWLTVTPTSA